MISELFLRKLWPAYAEASADSLRKQNKASLTIDLPAEALAEGWWRRRESNPRPEILPSSFYMLSSSLRYRPAEFPGTSFLQHYPAKIRFRYGRRIPETTLLSRRPFLILQGKIRRTAEQN
jgi:hypothetical protein